MPPHSVKNRDRFIYLYPLLVSPLGGAKWRTNEMNYEEALKVVERVSVVKRVVPSEGGGSYDYLEVEFPDGLPPGAKLMLTGNGPDQEGVGLAIVSDWNPEKYLSGAEDWNVLFVTREMITRYDGAFDVPLREMDIPSDELVDGKVAAISWWFGDVATGSWTEPPD